MAWVVDTCVILDVLDNDARHGRASAVCLAKRLSAGLLLSPVSFVELAPAFLGDRTLQTGFLTRMGVSFSEPWRWDDTLAAHRAWMRCIEMKRGGRVAKRPIADILIGAFALRFEGLITRNTVVPRVTACAARSYPVDPVHPVKEHGVAKDF